MAAEIFPPIEHQPMELPDWNFGERPEVKVEESELGDGYVFRQAQGLNFKKGTWQPVWSNLDPVKAQALYDWLLERVKLVTVQWTHPVRNTVLKVTIEDVSLVWDQWNNAILSVSFKQSFNPV
jgi:phage-related protein